jgi:glycosyltransferase involved in cell wall biosynthesis
MPTLSIMMPVFNERSTIEAAIEGAVEANLPVEARELIVVDDGSTDGTREVLRDGTWPDDVRVVFHDRNRGKGAAVRTALEHATGDYAAILDADLEYAAADLGPCSSRCSRARPRRLRHARLDVPVVVQLLVRDGQQVGHDGDERPLQLLDLGRDDLPQGMSTELFRSLRLRERGFAIEPEIAARVLAVGRADLRGSDRLRGPLTR